MRRALVILTVLAGCAGGEGKGGNNTLGLGDGPGTTGSSSTTAEGSTTAGSTADGSASGTDGTTTEGPADTTEQPPPACEDTWRVTRAEGTLTDLTLDEGAGTVYAVGTLPSGVGWAMALDTCDGAVLADTTVEHGAGTSTRLDAVTLADGGVFVVGSTILAADPRNGLVGRLDAGDLTTLWTAPLFGSADQDELLDVAVSADGSLWMTGTSHIDTTPTAWTVYGNPAGMNSCGFGWNGLGSGSARAVAADGNDLVVAVRTSADQLVLLRYDQACTCMCQPTWESAPIDVGLADTSVGEVRVVGGQYYVAGWAHDDASLDLYGYLAWVSSMGVLVELFTTNLTAERDGFFIVEADADQLYLGGGEGWTGEAGFIDTTGILMALPLPLGGGAQPSWEARPAEVDIINSIGVSTDGWLYVGGNTDTDGTVLRCDTQGTCG